jgi:hypothetical protein
MASITKLREIVGLSEGDLINKSLISFVEQEIKCAWKNKEKYIEDLKGQVRPTSNV